MNRASNPVWRDLLPRTLSALALAPLALWCAWHGGWPLALALAASGVAMLAEWRAMCRGGSVVLAMAGWPYVILPLCCLFWLRTASEHGRDRLLLLLAVVWAGDVAAYLGGRVLRGPKLAPRVSPGKTWSGAACGLGAAMLVGAGAATCYGIAPARGMAAALALGVAAQLGDLFESWVKRRRGVKDSGRLIPGHGGVLDRLDALLFAAPVAALIAGFA